MNSGSKTRRVFNVNTSNDQSNTLRDGSKSNNTSKKLKRQRTATDKENVPETDDARNVPGPSDVHRAADEEQISDTESIASSEAEVDPRKMSNEDRKTNNAIRRMLVDEQFDSNNFPENTRLTIERNFFSIASVDVSDNSTAVPRNARYLKESKTKCIICNEGKNSDEELIRCEGKMNGGNINVPCRSRFHVSCAKAYNANGFQFQYAAFPECQNKMLCPLHCCAWCTANGRQQTAYMDGLIDCVKCMRSFHYYTCVPTGSVEFLVDLDLGNGDIDRAAKMMICPAHPIEPPESSGKALHIPACHLCDGNKGEKGRKDKGEKKQKEGKETISEPLLKCKDCVRSYHAKCIKVKTVDGRPFDASRCDFCQCDGVMREDVPVLVKWQSEFWMAETRSWVEYPKKKEPKLGYIVVQWVLESNPIFSIVSINDVALLVPAYLSTAKTSKDRADWEKNLRKNGVFDRYETVFKEVNKEVSAVRRFKDTPINKELHHVGELCGCTGPKRCSTVSCLYRGGQMECPPICTENGRVCHNRQMSDRCSKGLKKIERRKAGKKGYGVFAVVDLEAGEYIGEYVGELIGKQEKERRREVLGQVNDSQANHYMMDLAGGFAIDAARSGNITRYINHSCEPNCQSVVKPIWYKSAPDDTSLYVERVCLVTIRKIAANEELTFDYRMDKGRMDKMDCYCGASKCTGSILGNTTGERDSPKDKKKKTLKDGKSPAPQTLPKAAPTTKTLESAPVPTPKAKSDAASKTTDAKRESSQSSASSAGPAQHPIPKTTPKPSEPAPKPSAASKTATSFKLSKPSLPSVTKYSAGPSSSSAQEKLVLKVTKPVVASDGKALPLFHQPLIVSGKRARTLPKKLLDGVDLEPMMKKFALAADSLDDEDEANSDCSGDKDEDYEPEKK